MDFPIWKTVETGSIVHSANAYKKLKSAGVNISGQAARMLEGTSYAIVGSSFDLVLATPRDIGVTEQVTRSVAYRKAADLGLYLCPPETAVALLLQEPNLVVPKRGIFHNSVQLAMVPIPYDCYGNDCEFAISERSLGASYSSHFSGRDDDKDLLVFIRGK